MGGVSQPHFRSPPSSYYILEKPRCVGIKIATYHYLCRTIIESILKKVWKRWVWSDSFNLSLLHLTSEAKESAQEAMVQLLGPLLGLRCLIIQVQEWRVLKLVMSLLNSLHQQYTAYTSIQELQSMPSMCLYLNSVRQCKYHFFRCRLYIPPCSIMTPIGCIFSQCN